jgi:hypothetical protein
MKDKLGVITHVRRIKEILLNNVELIELILDLITIALILYL